MTAPSFLRTRREAAALVLEAGEPANLVLVDPDAAWTVDRAASHSLSRNNPWHGRTLPAPVVATFLRGECTAYRGRIRGQFDPEELS